MVEYEGILDAVLNSLKKLLYPQEWIALDLEFSKSELFTLLLVERHDEIIMSRIAEYVNVSMSTANGIVERLVKGGYLQRDRSDADRRIVVVRLTAAGQNLVDEIKSTVVEYIKLIYEELDDDERRLILKVLDRVMNIISAYQTRNREDSTGNQIKNIPID